MPDITDQPWLQFQQHEVRQLAFAIASPPLLQHWPDQLNADHIALPDHAFWQHHFKHFLPCLQQLDRNPTPLIQHLNNLRSTRLGIRFEGLLAFWLMQRDYHPYEVLGQSVKRMDGLRTLGEMDFVLRNGETQLIEHWEVAIKFYLGEDAFQSTQWIGLNRRDSLGRKIRHLTANQFSTQQYDAHPIDRQRAIIKGRLFYPVHQQQYHSPDWLAANHLTGQWGYQLPTHMTEFNWRRAQRQEWLAEDLSTHVPSLSPRYWAEGLYFAMQHGQVAERFMLRHHHVPFTLLNK